MSAFGAWLDGEMRKRGWNQTKLAEISGVPDASISRILKGAKPSPPNIVKFAKALEDEPTELMVLAGYPVGDPEDPNEIEKQLLVQVRSLPLLRELIPDILSLSPQNQVLVQSVIRSILAQQEGDSQE